MQRRQLLRQGVGLTGALFTTSLVAACSPASPGAPTPTLLPTLVAPPTQAAQSALKKVTFGTVRGVGDAPVFVGMDQGYFAEKGIEIDLVDFSTAVDMVPPLGSGQLNIGSGISSAGLWNAIARGVGVKVVAGTTANDPTPPQACVDAILVRKALVDSGRVKSPADLKGLTLQTPPPGNAIEVIWSLLLKSAGLTKDDFTGVQLAITDVGAAMIGGKVDAAATTEPTTTLLLSQGVGSVLIHDYELYPNFQFGLLYYSPDFAQSELAQPFMDVFLRGARLYNDAFVKNLPEVRSMVIQALVAKTALKDVSLYDRMNVSRLSPDGTPNIKSLQDEQDYFLSAGEQTQAVDMTTVVDLQFARSAVSRLGTYS